MGILALHEVFDGGDVTKQGPPPRTIDLDSPEEIADLREQCRQSGEINALTGRWSFIGRLDRIAEGGAFGHRAGRFVGGGEGTGRFGSPERPGCFGGERLRSRCCGDVCCGDGCCGNRGRWDRSDGQCGDGRCHNARCGGSHRNGRRRRWDDERRNARRPEANTVGTGGAVTGVAVTRTGIGSAGAGAAMMSGAMPDVVEASAAGTGGVIIGVAEVAGAEVAIAGPSGARMGSDGRRRNRLCRNGLAWDRPCGDRRPAVEGVGGMAATAVSGAALTTPRPAGMGSARSGKSAGGKGLDLLVRKSTISSHIGRKLSERLPQALTVTSGDHAPGPDIRRWR